MAGILASALLCGAWLIDTGAKTGAFTRNEAARLFSSVYRHVERDFVDPLSDSTLYRKAVDGMLRELHDPYSVFLAPERLTRLNESTSGNYAGLGIEIDIRNKSIIVVGTTPGGPAEHAGVQAGDRIVGIDAKPTDGWTSEEASHALRGLPGTRVMLKLERPGVSLPVSIPVMRAEIHQSAVRHVEMFDGGVGYIDVKAFSDSTEREINGAVSTLLTRGMQTLILDLRGNPGGLLEQGVRVSDLFLDPGQRIVGMRGRVPAANVAFADSTKQTWSRLPLVVLVDGRSASASEIVAGALQDHDRAVIVGTPTYGKGSAQSVFPFSTLGGLKLTTARWYTPAGRSIARPLPSEDDEDEADPAASKGKEFRTDAGRVVHGGGGITPDVAAGDTVVASVDAAFIAALGARAGVFRDLVTDYALELRSSGKVTSPSFSVTPEMREEVWKRMQRRKIELPRAAFDSGAPLVSRILSFDIARFVFGGEAEFRRRASVDAALIRAIALARGATSQKTLLSRASAAAITKK